MIGLREPPGCPGEEELVIHAVDDGTDYMLDAICGQFDGVVIRRRDASGAETLYRFARVGELEPVIAR